MTRVNLLRAPSERWRRLEPFGGRRAGALACAVALAVLVGAVGSCAWGLHHEAAGLEDQIDRAHLKASHLRSGVARDEAARHASQLLRQHVDALEALDRARRVRARVLLGIGAALPADSWLTAITEEGDDAVRIEGKAPAISSLFAFVAHLEQSNVFAGGVDVLESHTGTGDAERDLATFTVRTFITTRAAPKGGPAGPQPARSSSGAR